MFKFVGSKSVNQITQHIETDDGAIAITEVIPYRLRTDHILGWFQRGCHTMIQVEIPTRNRLENVLVQENLVEVDSVMVEANNILSFNTDLHREHFDMVDKALDNDDDDDGE